MVKRLQENSGEWWVWEREGEMEREKVRMARRKYNVLKGTCRVHGKERVRKGEEQRGKNK